MIYHGIVFVDTFSNSQLNRNTIIRKKERDISQSPFQPFWLELDLMVEYQGDKSSNKTQDNIEETIKNLSSSGMSDNQQEFNMRLKTVKAWLSQPSSKRTAQWRANFCKKWDVSKSTLYRWVKQYREEGKDGLISKYYERGVNSPYDDLAYEFFEKARKEYLQPNHHLEMHTQNWKKSGSILSLSFQANQCWRNISITQLPVQKELIINVEEDITNQHLPHLWDHSREQFYLCKYYNLTILHLTSFPLIVSTENH